MRRVSRLAHQALVGVFVFLLALDSASACRLLAGRRSCCCRCTCTANECLECEPQATPGEKSAEEPTVPSPAAPLAEPAPAPPAESAPLTPTQPRAVEPALPVAPPTAPPPAAVPVAPAPMPAVVPARSEPAPARATPATPADDPFAPAPTAPPAVPAPRPAAPPAEAGDDPFTPARPTPRGAAPAAVTPDEDDPFAPIPARPASAPLAGDLQRDEGGRLPLRRWTDNSGQFQARGRLILILDGKVRLLKETGRTTTVALERLSAADRRYIEQVVAAYGSNLADALIAVR